MDFSDSCVGVASVDHGYECVGGNAAFFSRAFKPLVTIFGRLSTIHFGGLGAIQVLRNADGGGGGGVKFSEKKLYEGVRFNVISITRGWVGVQFPGKKRYITLEWPLRVVR